MNRRVHVNLGLALVAAGWTAIAALLAIVDRFIIRLGGTSGPGEVERVYALNALVITLLIATIGVVAGRRIMRVANGAPGLATIGRWCVWISVVAGLIAVADRSFHTFSMYLRSGANP